MLFPLKSNRRRTGVLLASENFVLAAYTLDSAYVSYRELRGEPTETFKILPGGTVLSLNPTSQKVVPNYSSYEFGQVGVLQEDANCGNGNWVRDVVVDVIFRGDIYETECWDEGSFGSVLASTKAALSKRVQLVKEKNF